MTFVMHIVYFSVARAASEWGSKWNYEGHKQTICPTKVMRYHYYQYTRPNRTQKEKEQKASSTKICVYSGTEMVSSGSLAELSCLSSDLCSQSESGRQMHFQPGHFPQKGGQFVIFYEGSLSFGPRILLIIGWFSNRTGTLVATARAEKTPMRIQNRVDSTLFFSILNSHW